MDGITVRQKVPGVDGAKLGKVFGVLRFKHAKDHAGRIFFGQEQCTKDEDPFHPFADSDHGKATKEQDRCPRWWLDPSLTTGLGFLCIDYTKLTSHERILLRLDIENLFPTAYFDKEEDSDCVWMLAPAEHFAGALGVQEAPLEAEDFPLSGAKATLFASSTLKAPRLPLCGRAGEWQGPASESVALDCSAGFLDMQAAMAKHLQGQGETVSHLQHWQEKEIETEALVRLLPSMQDKEGVSKSERAYRAVRRAGFDHKRACTVCSMKPTDTTALDWSKQADGEQEETSWLPKSKPGEIVALCGTVLRDRKEKDGKAMSVSGMERVKAIFGQVIRDKTQSERLKDQVEAKEMAAADFVEADFLRRFAESAAKEGFAFVPEKGKCGAIAYFRKSGATGNDLQIEAADFEQQNAGTSPSDLEHGVWIIGGKDDEAARALETYIDLYIAGVGVPKKQRTDHLMACMRNMVKRRNVRGLASFDTDPDLIGIGTESKPMAHNCRTGRSRLMVRGDFLTLLTRCYPNENMEAEALEWLHQLTGFPEAGEYGKTKAAFLLHVVGASCYGKATLETIMLQGKTMNGKSTFLRVLRQAFGDYAGVADGSYLFDSSKHETGIDLLKGKRLALVEELETRKPLDMRRVKHLTGGSAIPTRGMHKDFGEPWTNAASIFICTNALPIVQKPTEADRKRLLRVNFPKTFEKNETQEARFLALAPGILSLALKEAVKVAEREAVGLPRVTVPQELDDEASSWLFDGYPLQEWISTNLERGNMQEDCVILPEIVNEYRQDIRAAQGADAEGEHEGASLKGASSEAVLEALAVRFSYGSDYVKRQSTRIIGGRRPTILPGLKWKEGCSPADKAAQRDAAAYEVPPFDSTRGGERRIVL